MSIQPGQPLARGYHLEAGQTVGNWRIVSPLARGGMGEVYRAEHVHRSGVQSALKLCLLRAEADKAVRRFLDEARILSKIRHANVVGFYEGGFTDAGQPWMATEYLTGKSLVELVALEGRITVPDALDICAEIADGVHAAHELGVLHRDLKPANVFVTTEGKVKVLDFGIAKPFEGREVVSRLAPSTEADMLIGTWNYMAPEQLLGERAEIGRATDVFSLGAMAYELLAGISPWALADGELPPRGAIGHRIVLAEPIALTKRFHDFPNDVWVIVDMALQKKPKDRFQTMAAFAERLRRARSAYFASRGLPQGALDALPSIRSGSLDRAPKRGGTVRAIDAAEGLEAIPDYLGGAQRLPPPPAPPAPTTTEPGPSPFPIEPDPTVLDQLPPKPPIAKRATAVPSGRASDTPGYVKYAIIATSTAMVLLAGTFALRWIRGDAEPTRVVVTATTDAPSAPPAATGGAAAEPSPVPATSSPGSAPPAGTPSAQSQPQALPTSRPGSKPASPIPPPPRLPASNSPPSAPSATPTASSWRPNF